MMGYKQTESEMDMIAKIALCWRILRARDSMLLLHAERELPQSNGDEMQSLMNQQLLEMVLVFSTHGHSGFSASYARSALNKLLSYEPLRPLTGEPNEWTEVGEGVFQNKRYSGVFKQANMFDGQAYDINARVFREKDGVCYTSRDSFVPITFPYTPKKEYVDV